ncbi:motility associated factor glycosyltransferase family protein [Campylobacter sp.]|uniref:motility associated factor glycosyltransferase family protein n=1 Tax=Campylobacter sp. TaxID=205 RepID=UPI0026DBC88E|nr:motility associated factor glycosyltransferase family protein [Campylobacter sp.]MDO4674690.1 motility associated factor glycosyltransferase family protein [Campylobacter sp.]
MLYFYGFGNGLLLKALAANPHCHHLVIFESRLQILWTIFHCVDFSEEFERQKFILIDANTITAEELRCLLDYEPFFSYAKTYFLEPNCEYYERFGEDLLRVNSLMMGAIKFIIYAHGNDPLDALQGIEQLICNLAPMIENPTFGELLQKRRGLCENAIIVSTGPSLTKQLPLLKQVQGRALIFAADSAYPILAKWGIRPDFVCMVERSELTAEFFKHDFGEFDAGVVFLCLSLVHPNALKFLKQNGRSFILIPRDGTFERYLALKKWGVLANASNVACMNYILANALHCKNIILIGQDLSYDERGFSHPKDYQNSQDFESAEEKIPILAYGGDGEVLTHAMWLMFKQNLEDNILRLGATCYNATEGGARIEHSIEKPFGECCEELLGQDLQRPFARLWPLNFEKQNELLLTAWAKIEASARHCEDLSAHFSGHLQRLEGALLDFSQNSSEDYRFKLTTILGAFEEDLNAKGEKYAHVFELLHPYLVQWRLNFSKILVLQPKTIEDDFNKIALLAQENLKLLEFILGALKILRQKIYENKGPLKDTLEARNLTKYLRSKNAKNHRHN